MTTRKVNHSTNNTVTKVRGLYFNVVLSGSEMFINENSSQFFAISVFSSMKSTVPLRMKKSYTNSRQLRILSSHSRPAGNVASQNNTSQPQLRITGDNRKGIVESEYSQFGNQDNGNRIQYFDRKFR